MPRFIFNSTIPRKVPLGRKAKKAGREHPSVSPRVMRRGHTKKAKANRRAG